MASVFTLEGPKLGSSRLGRFLGEEPMSAMQSAVAPELVRAAAIQANADAAAYQPAQLFLKSKFDRAVQWLWAHKLEVGVGVVALTALGLYAHRGGTSGSDVPALSGRKGKRRERLVHVEAATPSGLRWLRQHARGATVTADGAFAVTNEAEWAGSLKAAEAREVK